MSGLNSTDPFAENVHGTNPQNLIEKITRLKIYNSRYWKEQCFGLTSELLVDKAIALKYIGGVYSGNNKPTAFLCLICKLLQLQPEKEIILEYINNEDFKYLRALGAFYLRLTGKADEIYLYLEPLLNDFRKVSYRGVKGWESTHVDVFIDNLLSEELVCDIALPHLAKRHKLEEQGILSSRQSILEDEFAEYAFNESLNEMIVTASTTTSASAATEVKTAVDHAAPLLVHVAETPEEATNVTETRLPLKDSDGRNDGGSATRSRSESRDRSPVRDSRRRDDGDRRHSSRERSRRKRRSRSRDRGNRRRSRSRSRDSERHRRRYSRSRSLSSDRDRGHRRDRRHRSRSRSADRYSYRDDKSSGFGRHRRESVESDDRRKLEEVPIFDKAAKPKSVSSSKNFDRIFGAKSSTAVPSRVERIVDAPEGSVEYWNQMREKLGMKKLKEG